MEATKHAEFEDEILVDPLTGEVLEDGHNFKTEDLPKVLRIIRSVQRRKEMIEEFLKQEVERIVGSCERKSKVYDDQERFFMAEAERLYRGVGEKKLEYPGIGTVRMGQTRESINVDKYQSLEQDERGSIVKIAPEYFTVTELTKPDKKKMLGSLRDSPQDVPDVIRENFYVNQKQDHFVFKPE